MLKVQSPDTAHKSEASGAKLGLTGEEAVRQAYRDVTGAQPGARIEGVLVARQVDPLAELIVGVQWDPLFGPVVMVGMGGIFAETIRDTSHPDRPASGAGRDTAAAAGEGGLFVMRSVAGGALALARFLDRVAFGGRLDRGSRDAAGAGRQRIDGRERDQRLVADPGARGRNDSGEPRAAAGRYPLAAPLSAAVNAKVQ